MITNDLYRQVAVVLTGRPVEIRLRRPVIKEFDGQAYIYQGWAAIDINPWLDDDEMLYVFCHECGHIRDNLVSGINPYLPSGSLKLSPLAAWQRKNHPQVIGRERKAESWAQVWLHYAERHYRNFAGLSTAERKLNSLLHWRAGDFELFVKRALDFSVKELKK